MYIVVDFDGTCTSHAYPEIGYEIGAAPVLKKLVEAGHKLILFTMRDDKNESTDPKDIIDPEIQGMAGMFLTQAVNWFKGHGIPLYGIQTNPSQKSWTRSPKAYGHIMIDDAALGCPLIYPGGGERPYVDWTEVEVLLKQQKVI